MAIKAIQESTTVYTQRLIRNPWVVSDGDPYTENLIDAHTLSGDFLNEILPYSESVTVKVCTQNVETKLIADTGVRYTTLASYSKYGHKIVGSDGLLKDGSYCYAISHSKNEQVNLKKIDTVGTIQWIGDNAIDFKRTVRISRVGIVFLGNIAANEQINFRFSNNHTEKIYQPNANTSISFGNTQKRGNFIEQNVNGYFDKVEVERNAAVAANVASAVVYFVYENVQDIAASCKQSRTMEFAIDSVGNLVTAATQSLNLSLSLVHVKQVTLVTKTAAVAANETIDAKISTGATWVGKAEATSHFALANGDPIGTTKTFRADIVMSTIQLSVHGGAAVAGNAGVQATCIVTYEDFPCESDFSIFNPNGNVAASIMGGPSQKFEAEFIGGTWFVDGGNNAGGVATVKLVADLDAAGGDLAAAVLSGAEFAPEAGQKDMRGKHILVQQDAQSGRNNVPFTGTLRLRFKKL